MYDNRNLQYYRGQYNPSSIYGYSSGAEVFSMYNPESEARLTEALAKRQERFDAAKLAEAQELARLGETETYDLAELNNRINTFESNINKLVKEKYNGDYSAAANEIAKMIGTERSNPFYHFNKQKVEMGKAYLDAKMKLGANFLSAGNPFDVSFQDWQQGATFEFTPINSADITQRSASLFQNFAKQVRRDSGLQNSPEGQYFKHVVTYGFRDENEAMKFAKSSGLIDQIYDSMPELRNVKDQDAVMDAIRQGAIHGIGTTETKYLTNQDYALNAALSKKGLEEEPVNLNVMTPTGAMDTKGYFKGYKNEKGFPLSAVKSYTINELAANRVDQQSINALNTIKNNLSEHIKTLVVGPRPNEHVSFIGNKSERNAKAMNYKEPITIIDVGFSPKTSHIILGIAGYNKEGEKLEAGVVLDAGTEDTYPSNNHIFNMIPYLSMLGDPRSDFNKELYNWLVRNYPSVYKQSLVQVNEE